jgi:sulfate permease, SulP family
VDRLKRSHLLEELTGKVHLIQYDAVSSINPGLALRTLEANRIHPKETEGRQQQ